MFTPTQDISSITEQVFSGISDHLYGKEYHIEIGKAVDELPDESRQLLGDEVRNHLKQMAEKEASDIDMGGSGCDGRVWYRIHGKKAPDTDYRLYTKQESDLLLHNLLFASQRHHLIEHGNLDFSFQLESEEDLPQRFRADMYMELDHLALNMRRIDQTIRSFNSLELNTEVAKVLSLSYMKFGLNLVTGITGSGKSSTLDSIIDAHNNSVPAHIVIIASPVELIHKPKRCIIRHREVGRDTTGFKQGAIESMRQDPDIIVIGELRDPETIMTALELTDSGHKTFSTLHTSSAMESIDRMVGEVPPGDKERVRNRLADVLSSVLSQKLVPDVNGKRVMAKEVLVATPSVRAAIRNNNIGEIYQMITEGSAKGMVTLEQDLKRLVDERRIKPEIAINYSNNKKRIKELLRN